MIFPIALVFLVGGAVQGASPSHPEEVLGTTGMRLCCQTEYWGCYQRCPTRNDDTDPTCMGECEKRHCVGKRAPCGGPRKPEPPTDGSSRGAPSPGGRAAEAPRPKATVHYDGQITGPGLVRFTATNQSTEAQSLSVQGILFGGHPHTEVLLRTQSYVVMPGQTTEFSFTVSPENFQEWSRRLGTLTVAFAFPDDKEARRWKYQNLLSGADEGRARQGEFQIRGAFLPVAP